MHTLARIALALACLLPLVGCAAIGEARDAALEAQRGVERLSSEYQQGLADAAAIREAYARGEISEAEREAALQSLRDELQASLGTIRDSLRATGEALREIDPEEIAAAVVEGARDLAPLLPGPWGELLAALLGVSGIGGAAYAVRKARSEGDRAIEVSTGVPARMIPAAAPLARPAPTTRHDLEATLAQVQAELAAAREKAQRTAADLGTAAVRRRES